MNNTNYIDIGKVLKPHGLRGELKCKFEINNNLENNTTIKLDDKEFTVISFRRQKDAAYIKLETINSIEQAELLRDKNVLVPESVLNSNEFSIKQLTNCNIIDNETQETIGKLKSIDNMPQAPVLNIKLSNEQWFLLPFILDEYISEINTQEKYIKIQNWQDFIDINN